MDSIRSLPGVLHFIRSPSGVHQESIRSIRTPDRLHQDAWGSVTYSSGRLPVTATPLSDSALNATATTSRHCDHHGNNGTHTTAGCYVLHPELRPKSKFSGAKPKAKMSDRAHRTKVKKAKVEDSDEESGDEDAMYNHTYIISQKSKNLYHAYLMSEKDSKDTLIHDSGASNTFIPHLSWVDPNTFQPLVPP